MSTWQKNRMSQPHWPDGAVVMTSCGCTWIVMRACSTAGERACPRVCLRASVFAFAFCVHLLVLDCMWRQAHVGVN